jgi:hypothetical protein
MTCRIAVVIPASLILAAACTTRIEPHAFALYTARGVVNVGLSPGNINPRANAFGRAGNALAPDARMRAVVKRALMPPPIRAAFILKGG